MSEETTQQQPATTTQQQPSRMGLTLSIADIAVLCVLFAGICYFASNMSIKSMIKAYPGA